MIFNLHHILFILLQFSRWQKR